MRCENCGHEYPSHKGQCPKCKRRTNEPSSGIGRSDDIGFSTLTTHTPSYGSSSSSYGGDSGGGDSSDSGGGDSGGGGGGGGD